MTEQERAELQGAVDHLNACLAGLRRAYGEAIRIQPITRFNDLEGVAEVHVEVTTGLIRFRAAPPTAPI